MKYREIVGHRLSDLNNAITILADDRDPECGNASHDYDIGAFSDAGRQNALTTSYIHFQHGAVKEVGLNGISDEALLAVVADRLQGFQSGAFSCRENAIALTHIETAILWLNKRTLDRMARGVEGVSKA